jgi:hypothetical protein
MLLTLEVNVEVVEVLSIRLFPEATRLEKALTPETGSCWTSSIEPRPEATQAGGTARPPLGQAGSQ